MPEPTEPRPIETEAVTLEDLSNALNGALGFVGAMLRKQNYTPRQIEVLLNEALDRGFQDMRKAQKERAKVVPMIEVVQ